MWFVSKLTNSVLSGFWALINKVSVGFLQQLDLKNKLEVRLYLVGINGLTH